MSTRSTPSPSTQTITIDELSIELTRKAVRNINLRVRPDGTVAVSAPRHVSAERIAAFVRSRRAWIDDARKRVGQQAQMQGHACMEGSIVFLWGAPLTCHIERLASSGGSSRTTFRVAGQTLRIACDERMAAHDTQAAALRQRALEQWLRAELSRHVELLLPRCQETVGASCSSWRLRRMSSRWGSCNVQSGRITLNTQLVHYPVRCLEYVLIHELCHLHEPNHGPRFHALMDQFYPQWPSVRAELNARPSA